MGTWGDGIYDNDGALDEVSRLVPLKAGEPDAARLVAQIGLTVWLRGVVADDELQALVDAVPEEAFAELPEDTCAALASLLADVEATMEAGSRSKAASAVLGGYCDGPRIDALLRFPGAEPVIEALLARVTKRLDDALAKKVDLYQVADALAALGVVIEMKEAGLWTADPARVDRWREGFAAIDQRTKEERGFWWKYVRKVRRGFDLLAPSALPPVSKASKPQPVVRARPLVFEPTAAGQRYLHPTLGTATLVARSGGGPSETLELRFDDGVVRKVLARFVAPIAGR
jgi:hypothetical protein